MKSLYECLPAWVRELAENEETEASAGGSKTRAPSPGHATDDREEVPGRQRLEIEVPDGLRKPPGGGCVQQREKPLCETPTRILTRREKRTGKRNQSQYTRLCAGE